MNIDQFWGIVARVHAESAGDMERKCGLFDAELRKLPLEELRSFESHFIDNLDRAYTWPLWAAAYIIGGGCSDDSFWDFRSSLISMGRETFERAVATPESLADMNYDAENAFFEGYQYVAGKIEEERTGGMSPRSKPSPKEPHGEPWDEASVANSFPKLARKYGFVG